MKKNYAILSAILAAALYALNAPASKLLLAAALDAYGGSAFPGGMPLDAFAAEMLARIRELA